MGFRFYRYRLSPAGLYNSHSYHFQLILVPSLQYNFKCATAVIVVGLGGDSRLSCGWFCFGGGGEGGVST